MIYSTSQYTLIYIFESHLKREISSLKITMHVGLKKNKTRNYSIMELEIDFLVCNNGTL